MLDSAVRPYIQPALMKGAALCVRAGLKPNMMTTLGLVCAFICFFCLWMQLYTPALIFLWLNRLSDGLDGPMAQIYLAEGRPHSTDFGGYYDILSDFILYGGVPLFFALGNPDLLLPSVVLLFGFILSGSSFLAYAVMAEKRGLTTEAQGKKGFYYMAGLMEGSETIAFFTFMMLLPAYYAPLAYIFAGLCVMTMLGRLAMAYKNFTAL